MRYEIKIPDTEYRQLQDALWARPGIESAAFMLAGVRRTATGVMLLARRIVVIPDTQYAVRSSCRIELSTRAINGLAALCEANGLIAVLAHSHPSDTPYSPSDDHGEARIADSLWPFVPDKMLGSLLFEIDPHDPLTFGGIAALLALIALVASYVPAYRATRVDPAETLRRG